MQLRGSPVTFTFEGNYEISTLHVSSSHNDDWQVDDLSYREVEATMELQATLLPKRYSKPKHDHFQTLNKCSLCLNLTRAKRNHQNKCLLCKKPRISSNVPLLYVATLHLFRLNVLLLSRHNTVLTVFYRLWHKKNTLLGLGKNHSLAKNNRLSLDHHNKSRQISPQSWICRT